MQSPDLPRLPAARAPAATSTTPASRRRSRGSATRSICSARTATPARSTGSTGSAAGRTGGSSSSPRDGASGPGTVTAYVPDIGGLLPVYVADRYEGFRVKTFPRADRRRARRLPGGERGAPCATSSRRSAASTPRSPTTWSWGRRSSPGPASRFAAKIHGSALEYTVKPEPDALPALRPRGHRRGAGGPGRLAPHGREPLGGARRPGAARQDPARPPGRRHRALRSDPAATRRREAPAELAASVASRATPRRRRRRVGPRPAAGGRGRRFEHLAAAEGPRVVMVGQADRLQGRRPAARGLAARPRARTPARAC